MLAAVLWTGYLATPSAAQEAPPTPRWDFIAFEAKAWGEPISSWRLTKEGGGSWTETRKSPADPLGAYTLVWHEIGDDASLYIALERILLRLPPEAPDPAACANRMTDMPYGTIRLQKGATTLELAWNSGCLDEDYQRFMAILREVDSLIAATGRVAPVLREERYPAP